MILVKSFVSLAFLSIALSLHYFAGFSFADNPLLYLLLALAAFLSVLLLKKQGSYITNEDMLTRHRGSLDEIAGICQVVIWQADKKGVLTQIIGWDGINDEAHVADLLGRDISVLNDIYPEFYTLLLRGEGGEEFVDYCHFGGQFYQHNFSTVTDDNGLVIGFQCVSLDITEDQRLYNRLAFSEQLIATAGEAVIILNRKRKVISVNQAFTRITGFSRQDILRNADSVGLISHPDAAFVRQVMQQLVIEGRWLGEMALRRRSEEQFSANVSISVIRGSTGVVTHYAVFFSDMSYMKRSHEELRYLATHDNLTDLPNRRLFLDRLNQGIQRAKRSNRQLAVFFIDLDNFKLINDSFGHSFGDALLKEISKRLLNIVRQSDTVARLGGDEFTVVIENVHDLIEVRSVAEKILSCFEKPFTNDGQQLEATGSVGIAIYPEDGTDVETLMKQADSAMYKAKALGRNGYFSRHDGDNSRASGRLFYPSELRLALKRKQMELVYQPLFDITQGQVVGCESLLRWNHHARGMIKPNDFMIISEEAGITSRLGEWTLNEVCHQLRAWRQQKLDVGYVSINIEMSQIVDPDYPEMIFNALHRYNLEPSSLMFEINEAVVLADLKIVTQFVRSLSQMGLRFCIDSFGSSGKNAAYVKNLSVEALKLDHRLLMRVNGTRQHIDLIQALAGIGDILDKTVIAVGVERPRQEEVLQEIGCHYAQGYLYGKPVNADFFGKAYNNLVADRQSSLH